MEGHIVVLAFARVTPKHKVLDTSTFDIVHTGQHLSERLLRLCPEPETLISLEQETMNITYPATYLDDVLMVVITMDARNWKKSNYTVKNLQPVNQIAVSEMEQFLSDMVQDGKSTDYLYICFTQEMDGVDFVDSDRGRALSENLNAVASKFMLVACPAISMKYFSPVAKRQAYQSYYT
ncbi:hypothetical protein BDA99DRAFT_558328 [Phascolomyces articulosus]|uniref:Uncharacterized protein n=1 Tax=Phascolomyces articulosus TaxID=60185 RepID=A0AAD5K3T0_9FUNG|nr:hypothetical protein BDA99DRAFT_558328 [Phascolomyces articulosus]